MSNHNHPQQDEILLIEDSPSQALAFRLMLENAGYRVTVVDDGAAGWRRACTTFPRLILLDIGLPSMDGFQILSRLKRDRRTAGIPVVMLTQRDHIACVQQAIDLGANDYLFKDDAAYVLCETAAQAMALARAA